MFANLVMFARMGRFQMFAIWGIIMINQLENVSDVKKEPWIFNLNYVGDGYAM